MNGGSGMPLFVDLIVLEDAGPGLDESELREIASAVCTRLAEMTSAEPGEVSVVIAGSETLRALNRDYRGLDRETDVLSFSQREGEEIAGGESLGDIVVSWPRVLLQAAEYGHSMEREFAFLTAHGFLHLLGYDHATAEDEARMVRIQEEALTGLGFTRRP